ncbi:hypothetical protein [Pseudogemmobacter humi]|uniref:Uncharacterized protein n=1 Tax=Pseudogemmobacter humi TaxID=2483812 RepID=A0A3P5XIR2_9RHOB|nr:hypothetical protein [Pseudogemmobacter humi]VDC28621.1 hypothetical protein XINFAN_02187 [Pseudogemmobacter humi]
MPDDSPPSPEPSPPPLSPKSTLELIEDGELNAIADARANSREIPVSLDEL